MYHRETVSGRMIQSAVEKATGYKTEIEFDLTPLISSDAKVYGARGYITNTENGVTVYVKSDKYSPHKLQIEYCYVHNKRDSIGGMPRRAEKMSHLGKSIAEMLQADKSKVDFELWFGSKMKKEIA